MKIRPATAKDAHDIESMCGMGDEKFSRTAKLYQYVTAWDSVRELLDDGLVIVAEMDEIGGLVGGFASVTVSGDTACIGCLYVEMEFRGQGVSGRLMEAAHDLARTRGAKLMVGVMSAGLVPFYEKRGYSVIGATMEMPL